jgi:hypothetical protein
MVSSGMLRHVALVTDVSEELSASIIRVTIGELETTLALTSNGCTLCLAFLHSVWRLLVTASIVSS